VYVIGAFIKDGGGIIYGDTDATPKNDLEENNNTASGEEGGHAVYVHGDSPEIDSTLQEHDDFSIPAP
jgi:hypothetical protein